MTTTTYTVYTGRRAANGRQRQRPQADSTRKKVIRLPISEAKKRANKKWDKENMRSFSVQLRKEVFEEAGESETNLIVAALVAAGCVFGDAKDND